MNTEITAKMEREAFAKKLKKLLKNKGKTQSQMSREIGIAVTTISGWMLGEKYPSLKNQQRLAEYFGVPRQALLSDNSLSTIPRAKRVPILGNIACGEPMFCEENIEGYMYDYSNKITNDNFFYLRANGDSMMPTIPNNALVLIRQQQTVENGEIAAVVIGEERELTLKRFKKESNTIILLPDNPSYLPIYITDSQKETIQVVGKAVSYTKDLES